MARRHRHQNIGTPTYLHAPMAIEAAKHGKHVVCEKPCGMNYAECEAMAKAAEEAGVVHYLNHNYRRVPAVAYAKQLIEEGKLGTIYHWRGTYLQDWIMDPEFPKTWHLTEAKAGGGVLFDLGSHAVDLARFLIGEPKSVVSVHETFIKERPLPGANAATFSKGESSGQAEMASVDVDDCAFMTLEFENGAVGSIDVSRFACGRKNFNDFEVYGSKGALKFNFERMSELQYFDFTLPLAEQGYRTILCTENVSLPVRLVALRPSDRLRAHLRQRLLISVRCGQGRRYHPTPGTAPTSSGPGRQQAVQQAMQGTDRDLRTGEDKSNGAAAAALFLSPGSNWFALQHTCRALICATGPIRPLRADHRPCQNYSHI